MITIIILLLLVFGFFMGLKRGLVMQTIHMIGFIVSFIVATMFYKPLADKLAFWIPYPELTDGTLWAVFLNTMPLESAFHHAIAFAIIFFGTKLVLQILASMIDFLANLPLLRVVNKYLGGVLGFIEVYVITFILLYIAALLPMVKVQQMLSQSLIAQWMIEYTPILSSLAEKLWFIP